MIHVCPQCDGRFKSWRKRSKCCSKPCDALHRVSIPRERIERLARAGMPKAELARELGCHLTSVRRAIKRYGLEREWRQMRYA